MLPSLSMKFTCIVYSHLNWGTTNWISYQPKVCVCVCLFRIKIFVYREMFLITVAGHSSLHYDGFVTVGDSTCLQVEWLSVYLGCSQNNVIIGEL